MINPRLAHLIAPGTEWPAETEVYRIWLDYKNNVFALVDRVDYAFALGWKWHSTLNSTRKKHYATRMTRMHGGRQRKIYLHKEILARSGIKPPTAIYTIGDHINGDSLDCRRCNLRWATHAENSRNRKSAK